mmetsp:Transcript_38720/g.56535  ORF Transcript_38720/g.56535 Transcript_38720/m.56535 type:complete len:288 (+) Transcript_38720:1142-2005(+)
MMEDCISFLKKWINFYRARSGFGIGDRWSFLKSVEITKVSKLITAINLLVVSRWLFRTFTFCVSFRNRSLTSFIKSSKVAKVTIIIGFWRFRSSINSGVFSDSDSRRGFIKSSKITKIIIVISICRRWCFYFPTFDCRWFGTDSCRRDSIGCVEFTKVVIVTFILLSVVCHISLPSRANRRLSYFTRCAEVSKVVLCIVSRWYLCSRVNRRHVSTGRFSCLIRCTEVSKVVIVTSILLCTVYHWYLRSRVNRRRINAGRFSCFIECTEVTKVVIILIFFLLHCIVSH